MTPQQAEEILKRLEKLELRLDHLQRINLPEKKSREEKINETKTRILNSIK